MKFGRVRLDRATGAILAHTVRWRDGVLRKGAELGDAEISRLRDAGIAEVVVARPEPGDVPEDEVATRIATALVARAGPHLRCGRAATGRVNLFAEVEGVLRVCTERVDALNSVDEALTLATLPRFARVRPGRMVATVKVMPYAVAESVVVRAERALARSGAALQVAPVVARRANLIVTRSPWTPEKLAGKGERAVQSRLDALGIRLADIATVDHAPAPVAGALERAEGELILVLGDSATSDRNDVIPEAIQSAGGRLLRFGMPVDPGNLLLLASLGDRKVLVLPGCARSPKLNGADWVLERVACGIEVSASDIAGMGVGGLLQEIPLRPSPRLDGAGPSAKPKVTVLLLAAGISRRMLPEHKLLKELDGVPLVVRTARALAGHPGRELVVVTGDRAEAVEAALAGGDVGAHRVVRNPAYREGVGASIRAGMAVLAPGTDAVIIAFADMPGVEVGLLDRLLGEFDPRGGQSICRAVAPDGSPSHPVLFGRRYFEALELLGGDRGARDVVRENAEAAVDVPVGARESVDLDTPEDWTRWCADHGN